MVVSNKLLIVAVCGLLAGVAAHQIYLKRTAEALDTGAVRRQSEGGAFTVKASAGAVDEWEDVDGEFFAREETPVFEGLEEKAPELPEYVTVADPNDSEAVRRRMVEEQVWRMEAYAREAGEDDPFAMSPERIEAFRQRGNPYVW